MNETPETPEPLAAIIEEMRDRAGDALDSGYTGEARDMLSLADRIEAAAKRERQDAMKTAFLTKCKVCEKVGPASAAGNAAAMRKALEYAREVLALNGFVEPVVRCDAALAAPARN